MQAFKRFLATSYTAYQAVGNISAYLEEHGFVLLSERDLWQLREGGKYYVVRGEHSLIAFRYERGGAKIVASHTDSPCFKLKENAALCGDGYARFNVEPYGTGLWYTFYDRPLKLAGRAVRERRGMLVSENFVSEETFVIPSLAIHQNRTANERFAPDLKNDLPLAALGECDLSSLLGDAVSYDLYAASAEEPFENGAQGEFLSSPRLDDLTGVYASLRAIADEETSGLCVAAFLASEEIGSRTYGGAACDFLRSVLARIAQAQDGVDLARLCAASLFLSLDNAQALHPNHPETCDATNRTRLGCGVVIKNNANGAYTTDALTSAIVKKILSERDIPYCAFFNRSDLPSGTTLGALSLMQAGIRSCDLGIAQLAMHSAVETIAKSDYIALSRALGAFYASELFLQDGAATVR